MQAVALRLEVELWATSKRNFPRLQAVLLGYHPPTSRPSLALRLSRAACIRDICNMDPFRATELVSGVQVDLLIYTTRIRHPLKRSAKH